MEMRRILLETFFNLLEMVKTLAELCSWSCVLQKVEPESYAIVYIAAKC